MLELRIMDRNPRIETDEDRRCREHLSPSLSLEDCVVVNSIYTGKVEIPWNLLTYECIIYDNINKPIYRIRGSKC